MTGCYPSEGFFQVSDDYLIAIGSERSCYRLPGYDGLCVKIAHGMDRDKQQNKKEHSYYAMLSRKGVDWSRLARCHGWVITNMGPGLVFDLVRDFDGSPSLMLDQYLRIHGYGEDVEAEIVRLKEYLILNNIIVCDLKEKNVACQMLRDGVFLKLIDGVGNRDFLKLSDWFQYFGRKKIERHWKRFEDRIRGI